MKYARLEKIVSFLLQKGAGKTRHKNGRTLLDHLVGTAKLLSEWGAPAYIVYSGLCHSLYGTNKFKIITVQLANRKSIQHLIGGKAEELVYLFCTVDRPKAFLSGQGIPLDKREDLILIELANLIDQFGSEKTIKELTDALSEKWKKKLFSGTPLGEKE